MSKSGFMLSLKVHEIRLCINDLFYGALEARKENNEEKVKEIMDSYEQNQRLLHLGIEMIEESLEDFDWQWAADEGQLCERDWEWFEKDLGKAGVNKEAHDKKWKVGQCLKKELSK